MNKFWFPFLVAVGLFAVASLLPVYQQSSVDLNSELAAVSSVTTSIKKVSDLPEIVDISPPSEVTVDDGVVGNNLIQAIGNLFHGNAKIEMENDLVIKLLPPANLSAISTNVTSECQPIRGPGNELVYDGIAYTKVGRSSKSNEASRVEACVIANESAVKLCGNGIKNAQKDKYKGILDKLCSQENPTSLKCEFKPPLSPGNCELIKTKSGGSCVNATKPVGKNPPVKYEKDIHGNTIKWQMVKVKYRGVFASKEEQCVAGSSGD